MVFNFHWTSFFYTLSLLVLNVPGFCQNERIAILIANQDYANIRSLKNPINEVKKIGQICKDKGFRTIEFNNCVLSEFNNVLDSVEKYVQENSFVYFHYAGHGIQIDDENYLIQVDMPVVSTIPQADRNSFRLRTLLATLDHCHKTKNIQSLICIDACRNNPLRDQIDLEVGLTRIGKLPKNSTLIFSCQPGESCLDGRGGLSPFAKGWIDGISSCKELSKTLRIIEGEYLDQGATNSAYIQSSARMIEFCSEVAEDVANDSELLKLAKF
jgi:hypothetical protein